MLLYKKLLLMTFGMTLVILQETILDAIQALLLPKCCT